MSRSALRSLVCFALLGSRPVLARACSVCFGSPTGQGASDAAGLNAGVAVLFVVLAIIQLGVALLLVRLLRAKPAQSRPQPGEAPPLATGTEAHETAEQRHGAGLAGHISHETATGNTGARVEAPT